MESLPNNECLSIIPSTDVIQLTLTLKMTTAQVVETSVTVNNSPIQDYVHLDDQTQLFEMNAYLLSFVFLAVCHVIGEANILLMH